MLLILCLAFVLALTSTQGLPVDQTDPELLALWEKNGHRMALVLMDIKETQSDMLDCQLVGDETIIHEVLKNIPAEQVRLFEPEVMSRVIAECTRVQQAQTVAGKAQMRASIQNAIGNWISEYFIMPGTKWCGAGDIAESYDDLGTEVETDKCCRTHDHCNDTIDARGAKYGLKNAAVHTKCHCDCDSKFYNCLTNAATDTAVTVGGYFFNKLQIQCFKMEHPIVKCIRYHNWAYLFYSCQEYEFDPTQPYIWQFFDAKYFELADRAKERSWKRPNGTDKHRQTAPAWPTKRLSVNYRRK